MKLKITLLILALLASMQIASAAGTGVSPGNFTFKLAPGASEDQSLIVFNMGMESASFSVSKSSSNVSDWITLSPATSFELEGKKTKEVVVDVAVPSSAKTGGKCNLDIIGTSGGILNIAISVPVKILVSDSDVSSVSSSGGFSKISNSKDGNSEFLTKAPDFSLFTITGRIKNQEVMNPVLNESLSKGLKNETLQLENENNNNNNNNNKTNADSKNNRGSGFLPGFDALFAGASLGILGLLRKR